MAHDLLSLLTVVDGILQQDRVLDDHKKALVESLLEKVTSLKDLLDKSMTTLQHHRLKGSSKEILHLQQLQSEIRDAAHEAEDVIESHALDQMLNEHEATGVTISPPDHSIREVIEKFDAAEDKLRKIINLQSRDEGETISNRSLSVAADPTNTAAAMMVGFEEDALHLKGRLTSQRRAREIIPIVGMGGIGKTTLARNLYNDPLIISHFDFRAWVTVSQDYNVQAILSGLLGSICGNISEDILGDTLYRRLYGKRYLIVLDDIWSEKAWDEIQRYFPNENHRSRILITSRELHVAKHADSACEEHQMHLLSDAQGCDLLCQKVFEKDERCLPSLEEIGRKIASDCGGLPLAICVIGGLLSVEKHSEDLWAQVARDVRSITDNHISEILCLSYDNLPLHLKSCFLYMSAFPEDSKVQQSKLVQLLVAEGFLWRSNEESNKSLEDVAEESLKALVDRNLLSVTSTKYNGRAKRYRMHDLLRDLCVRKAEEEKFLRIVTDENVRTFRRVSIHHRFTKDAEDLSYSRSLLFSNPYIGETVIFSIISNLRLLRVLDAQEIFFDYFPVEILMLANLRFLAVKFWGNLPFEIWRLRNLQTLLLDDLSRVDEVILLPSEAWEISGLRHIIFNRIIRIDFKVSRVHENLQTVSCVGLHDLLASNLINNIPNIKKLVIDCSEFVTKDGITDLSHLDKLETLELKYCRDVDAFSTLKLPNCLKDLSLDSCCLPMGFLDGVGDLQYLQVLKIYNCKFPSKVDSEEKEQEWELSEGVELCSLQFLELSYLSIARWKADYSHFPIIKNLRILRCLKLKEIPACFGEMSTLEVIQVDQSNPSHVDWANEVGDIQRHEYGNEALQIRFNW